MRGGDKPTIRKLKAGRAAHRAGRGRRRGVPRARRRARASRSTANRSPSSARARSSVSARCSKAACARRRCARSRSAGVAAAQRRSARPQGARADQPGPPPRGTMGPTGEAALLRRPRFDVGARCRFRARRRAHVVRRARARRRAVVARCSTRAPGIRRVTDQLDGAPFAGALAADPPALGSRARTAVLRGGRSRRRARARAHARAERRDGVRDADVLARAMSPPHFPIGPDGLRGDWTFEGDRSRAATRSRASRSSRSTCRTRAGARSATAIADGDRSSIAYIPDHLPEPDDDARDRTACARASTCWCTTRSSSSTSGPSPTSTVTRPSTTRSSSRSAATPARSRCSTTRPPRTDDEVDAIGRRVGPAGARRRGDRRPGGGRDHLRARERPAAPGDPP